MDEGLTHNACPVCKFRCHCHYCHTETLDRLKRLEDAKIDLDALLALYKDEQREANRWCEAAVESRSVARELFDELRGVAALRCGVDWEQETLAKYPWLKEEEE